MKNLIAYIVLLLITSTHKGFAEDYYHFYGKDYFDKNRFTRLAYDRYNDIIYVITVETRSDPYHYGISFFANNVWNSLSFENTGYPLKDTSQIKDILIDNKGILWMCSEKGILSYNILSGWKNFTISVPTGKDIIYNYLLTDSSGYTWFHATFGQYSNDIFVGMEQRLYKITNHQPELVYIADTNDIKSGIKTFSNPPGTSRATDRNGNFWIAYPQSVNGLGLVKINSNNNNYEFYQLRDYNSDLYQKVLYPYDLDIVSDQRLLVTYTANVQEKTRGGISIYNPLDSSWNHFGESDGLPFENLSILNRIENTVIDNNGIYWIGTRDWGIIKFNPTNKRSEILDFKELLNKPNLFFLNTIYDSFKDNLGNIWFSTGDGIIKVTLGPSFVDEKYKRKNKIEVFPNPVQVSKDITFSINNLPLKNDDLIIYDINGKIIKTLNVSTGSEMFNFNTTNMVPGIYIAKLYSQLISFVITN
ncbi:MAG: T9SS type A sorting domain-containing protein [bacterium]